MGRIINNSITSTFSGSFSDDVVFRQIGNQTFFVKKAVNAKAPSSAQRRNREVFAEAQNYASLILEDPDDSEWYSIVAKVNSLKTAQLAAVRDYMSKPELESINTKGYKGNIGDVIHIKPKMLLKIKRIEVSIHHADGSVLESGFGIKSELNWKYHATASNPEVEVSRIVVVAYDRLDKSCTRVEHF